MFCLFVVVVVVVFFFVGGNVSQCERKRNWIDDNLISLQKDTNYVQVLH